MPNILIIDDDRIFCSQLSSYIREMGHDWKMAHNLAEGLQAAQTEDFDIIFLDIFLPDGSGLDRINDLKQAPSSPEVMIITGKGDPDGAEIALKSGVWHYIEKPATFHQIQLLITRALAYRQRKRAFYEEKSFKRDFIIGNDPSLRKCIESVATAAQFEGNVLITGETGTGKELFARAVHVNSARSQKPYITVDCTNISPTLASSLLFGYKKGAFTGADRDKDGLIMQANTGMLFLDEVGDLPMETQKALLRVLQHKRYRPLGAKEEIPCEFRVVSATNRNLHVAIDQGQFRQDLYFRLAAFHISLPPLRQRKSDIDLLARHYLKKICGDVETEVKEISDEFMELLHNYSWPGNVRELINVLQTAIVSSIYEPVLYPHSLPVEIRINLLKKELSSKQETRDAPAVETVPLQSFLESDALPAYKDFKEKMEQGYLIRLMRDVGADIQKATELSGLSRARLYQLFKKHGFKGTKDKAFS